MPSGQVLKTIQCAAPDGLHSTDVDYTNNNCYGVTVQIGGRTGPISHINNSPWTFTFIYESGIIQRKIFYNRGGHKGWYNNTQAFYLEYGGQFGAALGSDRAVSLETVI